MAASPSPTAEARSGSEDLLAKVVLVGPPGVGKAAIVKRVAEHYAHSSVRAGEIGEGKIFRTEFFWPTPVQDGRRLRVRLFGISGQPAYNAVSELVLAKADGVVFVADLRRAQGPAVRESLQDLVQTAGRNGLDLATLPVALHYHCPVLAPFLEPEEMDRWLGIASGSVARFVTGPGDNGPMRAPVEWIVAQIAQGANQSGGSPHS